MQNLVNYFILYPYKSIVSVRFYFDVLFKMRGLGLVYMLIISTILAVFATFRFHAVVKIYDSINLPRLILEIPKSYLDENGVFSPLDGTTFYKEIYDDHGNLIILYNDGAVFSAQTGGTPENSVSNIQIIIILVYALVHISHRFPIDYIQYNADGKPLARKKKPQ